ncbi:MAG: hypothetical protein JSW00_18005 [Thermoplasmata archaeon]|nr:MAG: hypothetical protein JSW00_18005 [Thermoplasmata archaeon]
MNENKRKIKPGLKSLGSGHRTLGKTIGIIVLITAALLMVSGSSIAMFIEVQSWETDMGEWTKDYDLPEDPNLMGEASAGKLVYWHIERTDKIAYKGKWCLELAIDGRQDDGTVWMEKIVPANPKAPVTVVFIDFYVYSKWKSAANQWKVLAYAGVEDPDRENDFTIVGYTEPGVGWFRYRLVERIWTHGSDDIYVAFGISVLWESYREYHFDHVIVRTTGI